MTDYLTWQENLRHSMQLWYIHHLWPWGIGIPLLLIVLAVALDYGFWLRGRRR